MTLVPRRLSGTLRLLVQSAFAVGWLCFAASGVAGENDARFAAAREHLQKGRVDEALEIYDELTKVGADGALVAIGRSLCLEAQGEWKQATETLTAAIAKAEDNAPLHSRRAEVQLAQGQYEACALSVEQALAIDADQPLARLVQADLWTATGQFKQADEAYRWFVRYYNKAQPTDPETLLIVAQGSAQYARWHSVSQVFDFVINTLCPDALTADSNFWQAQLLSGQLLLEKYNRAQALPELRKALAINPRAADVHAALAGAALQEHSLAEADQLAGRALEINPRQVTALLIRADLRLEDGDFRAARQLAEEALTVNPHDESALARMAACDLFEDGPPPPAELDELFGNLDNISEATIDRPSRFATVVIALATSNPHPGVFLGELGERLEARKKFDLAERCYRQAVVAMPQLATAKTDLGLLYMRIGRNDEAAKILDDAFTADPYHVRVSNMRKVLKVLDGYETISTEHFLIRVDAQADKILGKYMAEYLEEQYPALVEQFRFEPPTKTQFEIFNKAKGLSAHQWFSARMVGLPWVQTIGASTGMMVALASPTATDKPFNWARVLKHEFVHILTLQQTQFNIPHWYTEALAVTSEGYPRPESWNRLLLERVAAGNLMNLDTINLGFIRPKTPDDWTMAYCQSRLYAQYMTEKFGADTTARLLEAYRQNLSTDQAIPRICGVDKSTFEKGYRQYLGDIVAGLKGTLPEPAVTLVEAEKGHRLDPDEPRAAARYAYELLKINRRKEARQLAEAALKKHHAEPLAAIVMARLELRGEDLAAAAEWLEPALDREQPHPQVLDLLAEIRLKQEKYGEAQALYDLGLGRDPDHVAWLKGLAAALIKGKQPDRLKGVLERLVETDSDAAGPRQKLARLALADSDFASAIRYGRLALQIDVLDVETHRLLAQAYTGLGQHNQAVDEWSVAVELKPGDSDLVVELARAEAAAGNKPAAVKRLSALLESKPDFAPAQALLDELK
ncbi:MAG: tetratricopeptide repeat protein [Planctomycetaceae bacterium]|nr:tetratricopeptide repeat protein [Planctomycetaceae bacterium]